MFRTAGGTVKHVSSGRGARYCSACKQYTDDDVCPKCGRKLVSSGQLRQKSNSKSH